MEDNKLGTEVVLTAEEAVSLADFLSNHLVENIRSDLDIDNINYVANLISAWEKCSAVSEQFHHAKMMDNLWRALE